MSISQIITLSISVIGLILSLVNTFYNCISRHRNIRIIMRNYSVGNHFGNTQLANVYLRMENHSQLSISITRLRLILNGNKFDVSVFPENIMKKTHRSGSEITSREKLTSTTLPINIMPLGGFAGFLSFPIPKGSLSKNEKQLTFEVSTNRGKTFQVSLEPSESPLLY